MKFILGKKIEMTQVFKDDGTVIPVTAVLATPNVVTQVKNKDTKDGYSAVQIGFDTAKKIKKSRAGHLKDLDKVKTLKEIRVADDTAVSRGDKITVAAFAAGDIIKVTGTSKGKGFQGVVKRHGFHGQKSSHGHKDQERMPGSIGAGGVQRVFKNIRMAGHMGDDRVTVSGLEIVDVNAEKNILYIKGALPGSRNSLVMIYGPGQMDLSPAAEPVKESASAETAADKEEIKTEEAVPTEVVEEVKTEEAAPAENEEAKS